MDVGRRISRENNQTRVMKPTFKKIELVYYLSRNGNLEHPHYIQVSHLSHHQLRLKDVLDRLTVLRGKGMPSLYSWSCKRSYKNGYVWNDLAQNDVIFPSQGGEYVLKGSELALACTEKLQHLQIGNVQQFQHDNNRQDSIFHPKRRFAAPKRQIDHHPDEEEEEKTMHTKCSRGVSTEDQTEEEFKHKDSDQKTELNLDTNSLPSPPSTTSSTLSDNPINEANNTCTRFEDGDPLGNEPMLSRNSMLFSLIACGGSGSFRKSMLPPPPPPPCTVARKSCSLHKGVVCKAAKMADHDMIGYMSENPRFGNLQSEEKEYFSGSIVESIANEERLQPQPALKKSSSYNHERSIEAGLGEVVEEEVKKEKGVKGRCIPRRKKSSSKVQIKQLKSDN